MDKELNKVLTCPKCKYKWTPRKENPCSCPRCKRRLDYKSKPTSFFHKFADLMEEEIEFVD